MDEAEEVNSIIALPGGHHNLGTGRRWHLLTVLLWVVNGLTYVTLLFVTGQWRRLIPTDWSVLPEAWHSLITYLTFHIPPESAFHSYDALQQLAYSAIVFVVAPLMILTGLCMSPAFIARFPWYPRLFGGRQAARSLHFLGLITLVFYVILHITLVLIVHFFHNISNMVFGSPYYYPEMAALIGFLGLVAVGLFHLVATVYSRRHQRRFQQIGDRLLVPVLRELFGHLRSRQQYSKADISPAHRVNGYPPVSSEYLRLADDRFETWRLRIHGLVERPLEFSLSDLRRLSQARTNRQAQLHSRLVGDRRMGGRGDEDDSRSLPSTALCTVRGLPCLRAG